MHMAASFLRSTGSPTTRDSNGFVLYARAGDAFSLKEVSARTLPYAYIHPQTLIMQHVANTLS